MVDFKSGFCKFFVLVLACLGSANLQGEPVCAKALITLRKGPGPEHPVSWRVAQHMPFLKIEKKGGWAKVQDSEGEVHWAKTSDLTSRYRCVVTRSNIASLRQEPSINAAYSEMKTVDRYTPFKRLEEQKGEWIRVEDQTGRKAWIHESNVWKPVMVQAITF